MAPVPVIPSCTGALVAGGQARRMGGIPKGLLRVLGEPIAARSLALFRDLFGATLVVANDPAPYAALGAPVIPDAIPGKGAPGGLHAALSSARTEWVFAAACDMPFLSAGPIAHLAALRPGADAVLVRGPRGLEPLHAFWSIRCLRPLEALLAAGDPSFGELAARVRAVVVEPRVWQAVDPLGRAFENVNTPEDAARLGLELDPPPPGEG